MQWQVGRRRRIHLDLCRHNRQIAVAKRSVLTIVPPDPDREFWCLHTENRGRATALTAGGMAGYLPVRRICGEVAEWSKAHAWKVCRRGTVSRVRIPLSPPLFIVFYARFHLPLVLPTTLPTVRSLYEAVS